MTTRFIERLEALRVTPRQWALTFVSIVALRLCVEMLFLDWLRPPSFFVLNAFYFLSVFLCLILLVHLISRRPLEKLFPAILPFSAIILIPLLDLFFYPHLKGPELLPLCRLPTFPHWQEYGSYALTEILSHHFLINPKHSLGLRLEIFLGGALLLLYVVAAERRLIRGLAKGLIAYFGFTLIIWAHAVLVVHTMTREWIFLFTTAVTGLLLLLIWRGRKGVADLWRGYPWAQTGLLLAIGVFAFRMASREGLGGRHIVDETLAAVLTIIVFGLFVGHISANAKETDGSAGRGEVVCPLYLPLAFALPAAYLVHFHWFLTLLTFTALSYLLWLSPLRLARYRVAVALAGGLALWSMAWASYSVAASPTPRWATFKLPVPAPLPGLHMYSGRPSVEAPVGPPPLSGFPPPPGHASPEAPKGPPRFVPPGKELRVAQTPPPETGEFADIEFEPPAWLYHPAWLLAPLLLLLGEAARRRIVKRQS